MNLKPSEAIVAENATLGIQAAIRTGMEYIIILSNTPSASSFWVNGVTI